MDSNPNTLSNINTHTLFFKIMTPKKLNELLLRASGKNSILEKDINARLKGLNVGYAEVKLSEEIKEKDKLCSLYINFKKENNQFGHITFHFDKKRNKLYTRKNGNSRFHAKNNRNKTSSLIRVTTNSEKSFITLSLSKYSGTMKPDLKKCVDTSLDVLNLYFKPGTSYYLGIHNPNIPLRNHSCLSRIIDTLTVNKGSLQPTRKQSLKTYPLLSSHYSISSSHSRRKSPWGKVSDDLGKSVNNSSK
jgi:hypothetical protein